ncbi:MAG: hypothetical protein ABEJ46_02845 [Gemmatimonadota bacterium]
MRRPPTAALLLAAALATAACWRVGEPTPDDAEVAWAAYPDTVVVGRTFSFEFAGPVSRNSCARLDTATVTLEDSAVVVDARRQVFDTMCPDDRVSYYRAGALELPAAGRWRVRTASGRDLGAITALDSGDFSTMKAVGWGTLRQGGGGCVFFGPGWANNQRPFHASGLSDRALQAVGADRIVWMRGRLYGWTQCGAYGSRPRIIVDSVRVTDRPARTYYYERPAGSGAAAPDTATHEEEST